MKIKQMKFAYAKSAVLSIIFCFSISVLILITISDIQQDSMSVQRPDKVIDLYVNKDEIERNSTNVNIRQQKYLNSTWKDNIENKIFCLNKNRGGMYLYHMRKSAGTSLRTFLKHLAVVHRMSYHETEGKILNSLILNIPGITSFTSLRYTNGNM